MAKKRNHLTLDQAIEKQKRIKAIWLVGLCMLIIIFIMMLVDGQFMIMMFTLGAAGVFSVIMFLFSDHYENIKINHIENTLKSGRIDWMKVLGKPDE